MGLQVHWDSGDPSAASFSICKKAQKKKKKRKMNIIETFYLRLLPFLLFRSLDPDGMPTLWESDRAHPGGLPEKAFLLAPAFWTVYSSWINFKGITEQAEKCTRSPDAYPNCLKLSNWLSNLSRAGISSTVLKMLFPCRAPNAKSFSEPLTYFFPAGSRKVCQWREKWNKANSWGCQVSHMILLDKGGASSYLISHQHFSVNPDSNIKHEKANSSSSHGSSSQFLTVDKDRC